MTVPTIRARGGIAADQSTSRWFDWSFCKSGAGLKRPCSFAPNPPPKRPDPWIYQTGTSQAAQFQGWRANPSPAGAPTFWIPDSDWQLASPGWIAPIPFWLPIGGVNQYSTFDANSPPDRISPLITATIGNDGAANAINVAVQLSVSPLGIGYQPIPIASQLVSVAQNSQVTVSFTTPGAILKRISGGSLPWYGAYIDLQFSNDSNQANNHALSMWLAIDSQTGSGPGGGLAPNISLANQFSSAAESVTLYVMPLIAGVTVLVNGAPSNGVLGPYALAPGQSVIPNFQLTVPANVDGGTFLAPLASVVGVTAAGNYIGGLTVVCSVND